MERSNTLNLSRCKVIQTILQNLVNSGKVKQSEYDEYRTALLFLDPKDLLTVLLESHNIVEDSDRPIVVHLTDPEVLNTN